MAARLLYFAGLLCLSSAMAEEAQVQDPLDDAEDAVSECQDYYCKTATWTSNAVSWVGTAQHLQFFLMIVIVVCFLAWSMYSGGIPSFRMKTSPKSKVPTEADAIPKDVVFEVPSGLEFEVENYVEDSAPSEEKQAESEKAEKLPLLLYRGHAQYPREDSVAKYGGLDAVHDAIDARAQRVPIEV
eukprot:gnl/MRDRNA2_/MRDRNA2_91883_c0_seq1.p1 gnl/MRDRNA2_/MRDRNA2_91883_c0~~gnl/MRDRNA2_/MRDRNA2_91883_c0_seq1.p1  ORF type:complete len:185 (+),score=42.97 gnl/MRDRNA2_/MRDRNA2_91883_c0_seq1:78-632(+)